MGDLWSVLSAIATVVSSVVVIVALLYARSQLREATRARSAAVALDFQARHEDAAMRAIRARLLSGDFPDLASLDALSRDDLERLVDHYETLATLVELRLLDREVARAVFRFTPQLVWAAAEPWIAEVRRTHQGYGANLEAYVRARPRGKRRSLAMLRTR